MNRRGEFNYVTPIFILVLIVGGWATYEGIPAFYSSSKYEADLSGIVFASARLSEEEIVDKMRAHFAAYKQIEFNPEDVIFTRNEENRNKVHAELKYRYLIHVPYTEKIIKLDFKAEIDKDLTLQNSF